MRHWRAFAGLASKYTNRPLHILFANPFEFFETVYPKVEQALTRADLAERPANFSFHRQATHPAVDRRGPAVVPGWNSSNAEIAANEHNGNYVVFDRQGQLVFHGRASVAEIETLVKRLIARR